MINAYPMGTISLALNVAEEHKDSYQTSSLMINAKPMGTIPLALNVTQGHKGSYQTALKRSLSNQWFWMLQRDSSVSIKQALNRSMPNILSQSQLLSFKEDQITFNTVIKVESLYQLIYFRYLMLQVNLNRHNYKFDVNI